MWHSPSRRSATSLLRNQTASASIQKGKTAVKAKAEEWEPLRGWSGDNDPDDVGIESIDIDSWSKKNNKRKQDASKGTPREGMDVYLCWTSNHCSEIADFDEFVKDSLSPNLTEPIKTTPSPGRGSVVKHAKDRPPKVPKNRTPTKKGGAPNGEEQGAGETKSSGEDSIRTFDADSEASEGSAVGRAISTAYTASECPHGLDGEDSGSSACGDSAAASGAAARSGGVTRSAPVSRVQDRTDQKGRKVASAKSTGDGASRPGQMRRVAIRNSAAKSSLDLKRLTLDLPHAPPSTKVSFPSSPQGDEAGASTQPKSEAEKAAVLRLVEERLKRSSASSRLNFDLPNSGSVSVGDLLSSSPRIVHRLGPAGDADRDPNVYAALVGDMSLTDHKESLSPWSHGASDAPTYNAIPINTHGALEPHLRPLGATSNGSRTIKDTTRSVLPSVPSNASLLSSSPHLDSTSTGDSVMMRQASPVENQDCQSPESANAADDDKLLKTEKRTKRRVDHADKRSTKSQPPVERSKQIERIASVVLGRKLVANSNPTLHRGPPGFRPAGKTPLQRAVESAHKKMHGQHYYLFTHSPNSQSVDVKNLPRYSSSGQPVSGHRERAASGRSTQSERSINNAYVWKEHLESQIKQQRSTTVPSDSNIGETSHQQTNPRTNQSSSATNAQQKKAQFQFQLGERTGNTSDFVAMFDRNGHALITKPKTIFGSGGKMCSLKPGTT